MSGKGYVPVIHGASGCRPDEADTVAAAEAVHRSLILQGYDSEILHLGLDLSMLQKIAAAGPLSVFNLVDAIAGDAGLAQLVPSVLDVLAVPYTGVHAAAWHRTSSKTLAKALMKAAGLATPDWSLEGGFPQADGNVIVKSDTEHASVGLDRNSIVPASHAPREIAAREQRYGGRFFAETFIAGREFNIGVVGARAAPRLLPASEIVFAGDADRMASIVDFDAKWNPESFAYQNTPRRLDFARRDHALIERLGAITLELWQVFGLTGYARVDFRVDEFGNPWILEVNANPCLTPDAGFFAAAAHGGSSYEAMVEMILAAALAEGRQGRNHDRAPEPCYASEK